MATSKLPASEVARATEELTKVEATLRDLLAVLRNSDLPEEATFDAV